jgi:uncharacterized sulfatase
MAGIKSGRVDRRTFIGGAVAGAAGFAVRAVLPEVSRARAAGSKRPNILFVFSDQQRWDTVDCYGAPLFPALTPNLNQMARTGVRFQRAFTPQPLCGPARSTVQTGRGASETGCVRNGIALNPNEKTLAHWLGEAGYQTGYIGKWHLGPPTENTAAASANAVPPQYQGGYQYWLASNTLEHSSHAYDGYMFDGKMQRVDFPPDRYRVDCLTDYAIEYLRTRGGSQPFFLFVSYLEPHHQNDHKHFEGPRGSKEQFKNYQVPADLPDSPMPGDWREELPDYLGCCHSLDSNLGRLLDQLKRMGAADNTLIIYASDHACHFRTHEGEYKRTCHDNSIRIPMIISGSSFTGGKTIHELVSLIDLPPTILSAAGLTPPSTMRGRALQELVHGRARDWQQEVFVQISEAGIGRAIRTANWTYAVELRNSEQNEKAGAPQPEGGEVYVEKYLFDLQSDAAQHHNLVSDPRYNRVRADLCAVLKRRMVLAGEEEPEIRPAVNA